jgi:hypothetical protein
MNFSLSAAILAFKSVLMYHFKNGLITPIIFYIKEWVIKAFVVMIFFYPHLVDRPRSVSTYEEFWL